jgi:hypothetical protein
LSTFWWMGAGMANTRWRIAVVVEVKATTEEEAEAAGWQVAEESDVVLECEGIWTEPLYVDRESLGKIGGGDG